jgi:hypothetical protein
MPSSSDRFSELEARIARTIELVNTSRHDKEKAVKALLAAQSQIKNLERELDHLKKERDLVKNKVESLLENLSELTEESFV